MFGIKERIFTPYGPCEVILNENMVTIPRHGTDKHLPPHRINHHAHLKALEKIGVSGIVAFGSVGSLHEDIPVRVTDDGRLFCLSLDVARTYEESS